MTQKLEPHAASSPSAVPGTELFLGRGVLEAERPFTPSSSRAVPFRDEVEAPCRASLFEGLGEAEPSFPGDKVSTTAAVIQLGSVG